MTKSVKKILDWGHVRKKVEKCEWAQAIVESLKISFKLFEQLWQGETPKEETAWSHHYFCRDCASRLKFDIAKPYEHRCSLCGKVYSGEPFDGAWRYWLHSTVVVNLEKAAVLANLCKDNQRYTDYIRRIILYYALHYEEYEIHGKNVGKARVFEQSLSEGIFVLSLFRAIYFVRELEIFTEQELEIIGEKFFRPAAELLKPQVKRIHNVHTWIIAGIGAAGFFLKDPELIHFAIDSTFGWKNQIQEGVREDGAWYEVAPNYHFYALSALGDFAWIAAEHGYDLISTPKFLKMFEAPLALVYENGEFPAYNDGWFGQRIEENASLYELIAGINSDDIGKDYLSIVYQQAVSNICTSITHLGDGCPAPSTAFVRNSVYALLFGPEELLKDQSLGYNKKSRLFQSTGIGILEKDNLRIGLKFTRYGSRYHDHYDKLALDVFAGGELISGDVGTSSYATDFTQKWCKSSVAHNMVVINGQKQQACDAKLISFSDRCISAEVLDAYDRVALKRTIDINKNGWEDRFEVNSYEESCIDWVFHCKGSIKSLQKFETRERFTEENGYEMLKDVKELKTDDVWEITWKMKKGMLHLKMGGEKGTTVFIAKCYGSLPSEEQEIVIVRRIKRTTMFYSNFEWKGNFGMEENDKLGLI